MTTFAFICGVVVGAFAALCITLVTIGILAHGHFNVRHARPQDHSGQPTYDLDGNLTGYVK